MLILSEEAGPPTPLFSYVFSFYCFILSTA
jgi:hypothetical protein